MADKSEHLILDALRRALAEPVGLPVFAAKNAVGLFPSNAAGKQAAQECQERGWLRTLRSETRGKNTVAVCALSETGLAHLLEQANPRDTLQEFLRSLEARRLQLDQLLDTARAGQQTLQQLADAARRVLDRVQQPRIPAPTPVNGHASNGSIDRAPLVLERLRTWRDGGALEDCPLPKLHQAVAATGAWTIGQFHDCLRNLHREQKIYLHPWTGALYEVPEPAFALLIGHEIAYYASLRA